MIVDTDINLLDITSVFTHLLNMYSASSDVPCKLGFKASGWLNTFPVLQHLFGNTCLTLENIHDQGNKMKTKPVQREQIFAKHVCDKGLRCKI